MPQAPWAEGAIGTARYVGISLKKVIKACGGLADGGEAISGSAMSCWSGTRAVRRGAAALSAFLLAVLLATAGPARANDSAAALDAGGLVLVSDPEVELVSEDLRIGVDRISVDYVFRNRSDAPRTLRVALSADFGVEAPIAPWSFAGSARPPQDDRPSRAWAGRLGWGGRIRTCA